VVARRKGRVLEHYGMKSWHAAKEFNIGAGMIDLAADTKEEARMMRPVMEIRYDSAAQQTLARVGATDQAATWSVTAPHVREAVDEQTFRFCKDTSVRFARDVDTTVSALRQEIAEGLVSAENTRREMSRRVNDLFKGEETWRADRIAATESSRAVHNGQIMGAAHSKMVKGFRLLVSADACPICRAAKHDRGYTELGDAQAQMTSYDRTLPPLHPNCQCSVTEVLTEVGPRVEPTGRPIPVPGVPTPPRVPRPVAPVPAPAPRPVPTVPPRPEEVLRDAVDRAEKSIMLKTKEELHVFDASGKSILKVQGTENRIKFTDKEWAFLRKQRGKGVVATHNHPYGLSLSPQDVESAWTCGLAEERAVGKGYRYSMKLPDIPFPKPQFQRELRNARGRVRRELKTRVTAGKLTRAAANGLEDHMIWEQVAPRLGCTYTRTGW